MNFLLVTMMTLVNVFIQFKAEPVGGHQITPMLWYLDGQSPYQDRFGEIASAIADASNNDPLFPTREDGSQWSACILTSIAFTESRFQSSAIGDSGKSFGLYQIQAPTAKSVKADVKAESLLVPSVASFIALDLVRQSILSCKGRAWEERLVWYVSSGGCTNHPVIVKKSMEKMLLAVKLMKRFFPDSGSAPSKDEVPRSLNPAHKRLR